MSDKDLEYNPDLYTLVDEEGVEQVFELLDIMEVEGQRYFALTPYFENPEDSLDDDGDLIVLKSQMVDGDEMMVTVDDDDEHQRVGELFIEKISAIFEAADDE
jgi:uncharacterized protein YrzB (UPF0473 family)